MFEKQKQYIKKFEEMCDKISGKQTEGKGIKCETNRLMFYLHGLYDEKPNLEIKFKGDDGNTVITAFGAGIKEINRIGRGIRFWNEAGRLTSVFKTKRGGPASPRSEEKLDEEI